ncbi:Structural maintenance of chromosomes protein 5 [Linum perenne]
MAEPSQRRVKMERPPAVQEPPFKRSKASSAVRGEDDYMPGSIIEMELSNFMTYDSLFCKPAPHLNLVIGPNGSGKSSIVCAIALGLCGEPQLLGRATSIGAYVKRGEDSGYIKISLKGSSNDEKITITRKIDTRNKSEWLFNGNVVSKKEVSQVIQRFNIQVNNLTQFLPQDRVCEFAKLSPVQLLEETEKAVGDPQLPIQHGALVEKSRELKNIELAIKRNGETLHQLKALNAELEKDVERVRQRDELLTKAELMKKKLPWLEYDRQQVEYEKAKNLEMDADKKLKIAAKNLKHFSEPIEKKKRERALLEDECKKADNIVKANASRRREHQDRANHLEVQLRGKYTEIEDLRREEDSRKQKILKLEEDLSAAEIELQNCPVFEPPKDAIARLTSQLSELRVSINETRSEKTEKERALFTKKRALTQLKDSLKDLENRNNKILYALKNSGTDKIFEAYNLVRQHQNELKEHVYGPVLLEVNVSDRIHADYLENRVPYYIWKSFITQDPSDRDVLVRRLKGFDIPILNCVRDESHRRGSFEVSDKMHELGIYSRLDQVFDAPDAIKEVLISQCGLDSAYIGSKESGQRANEVEKLDIIDLWTPENHYHWKKSRYSDHKTTSLDPISRSRLFNGSLSTGEIEKLEQKSADLQLEVAAVEESVNNSKAELKQLEIDECDIHKLREKIINEAQQEQRKRRDLENRIDRKKRDLQSLKNGGDIDRRMANLIDDARKINIQRVKWAKEMKNVLLEAVSCKRSYAAIQMASIEFDAKVREMEINLKEHKKVAEQAAVHLQHCKDEVEKQRKQLIVVKKHAESIAVLTPELGQAFLEMPTTVEELRAAIQDNISQANSILFLNQNVLEEYEHRQQKIETLTKKLEADIDEQKRCLEDIDELKASWLPKLRNLVEQINGTFSRNFQEMAVAGEVSLDEHDKDFDQYGILIKVKFRQAGELKVLSAHHQSGGERSVSTILYLVSLQDLTNCPFRVVDEINQGMDPINERKMFQQLVRAASQPNTPQCFLLTPKLLPDLEYSEACSILNIMNGPWIDQPSKVWSSGDCWSVVGGRV